MILACVSAQCSRTHERGSRPTPASRATRRQSIIHGTTPYPRPGTTYRTRVAMPWSPNSHTGVFAPLPAAFGRGRACASRVPSAPTLSCPRRCTPPHQQRCKPAPAAHARLSRRRSRSNRLLRRLLLLLVLPLAILLDQLDKGVARLLVRDGTLHDRFADIEVDLARRAADVAEVGVGHLAGAVDDAAHDRDRDAGQVARALGDLRCHLLQVEERAAAAGARDELRLHRPHARALQQAERRRAQRREREGIRLRRLHEDAIAEAVAEEAADLRAHLEGKLVTVCLRRAVMMDDCGVNLLLRKEGEEAARCVQPRKRRRRVEQHEGVVNLVELGERRSVLVAAHAQYDAGSAVGSRLAGDRVIEGHQRDRAVDGRSGQRVRGHDRQDGNVHHTLQSLAGGGIVRGGRLAQQKSIGGRDVLEGQAHDRLASQVGVKLVGRAQARRRDRREHRAVAVEEAAVVEGISLALLGQAACAASERGDVACVVVGGHGVLRRARLV
mmetsp:Transcript_18965/g.48520  ORF Transcript_18965/g.48520 Transcript_18965/m.48520 type:complete len:498 (+) Transcript_18965:325-1818(+)